MGIKKLEDKRRRVVGAVKANLQSVEFVLAGGILHNSSLTASFQLVEFIERDSVVYDSSNFRLNDF